LPQGQDWQQVDGGLAHVSVAAELNLLQGGGAKKGGNSAVWGVNGSHQVFCRTGATVASPGGSWQQVDGGLIHVAVEPSGQVWGVNAQHQIYRRTGITAQTPQGSGWTAVEGALKNLSIAAQIGAAYGTAIVWGVNAADDIFVKANVVQNGGNPWHKCEGKLKQVHVDSNGAVWGVNANEDVFRRTGISTQNPIGSGWEQVPGKLKFVTSGQEVGAPVGTSVVWGVNSGDSIYYRTSSTLQSSGRDWQQAPGGLAQIHADAAGAVWGTNAQGGIFRRTGISPQSPAGQSWEQVEGALKVVSPNASASSEGMAW